MSTRRSWLICLSLLVLSIGLVACTKAASREVSAIAILVIDDFDLQPPAGPPPRPSPEKLDCAYTGESTQDVGSKGANGGTLPAGVAHGTLVFDELRRAMNQEPPNPNQPRLQHTAAPATTDYSAYGLDFPYVHDLDVWTVGETEVALVGIDTAQYETKALTEDLQSVVASMEASRHEFHQFVINMSFVVAPCDVQPYLNSATNLLDAYDVLIESQPELSDLRSTLDALVQPDVTPLDLHAKLMDPNNGLRAVTDILTDEQAVADLPEAVRLRLFYGLFEQNGHLHPPEDSSLLAAFQQLQHDPLSAWLVDVVKSKVVVPVAAAGNGLGFIPDHAGTQAGDGEIVKIRLDFPFAPAMWNSVVSVSAAEADPHAASADPRARYSNGGEVMLDGRLTYQDTDLRGTSFAAPRLSYLEALYLISGAPVPCGTAVPPLGYSDLDDGSPQWDNMPVAAAATASKCAGFMTVISASP